MIANEQDYADRWYGVLNPDRFAHKIDPELRRIGEEVVYDRQRKNHGSCPVEYSGTLNVIEEDVFITRSEGARTKIDIKAKDVKYLDGLLVKYHQQGKQINIIPRDKGLDSYHTKLS